MATILRVSFLLLASACALGPRALTGPATVLVTIDRVVPESAATTRLYMRLANRGQRTIRGCMYPERTYARVGGGFGTQVGPPVHEVCAYDDEFRIRPGESITWQDSVSSQLVVPGEIDVTIVVVPSSMWRANDASEKVYLKARVGVPNGG